MVTRGPMHYALKERTVLMENSCHPSISSTFTRSADAKAGRERILHLPNSAVAFMQCGLGHPQSILIVLLVNFHTFHIKQQQKERTPSSTLQSSLPK